MRNLRHTEKQNRTKHHPNKKTTLKIQTQTKQTDKTTQKNTFYYLFIEKMENLKTIDKDCLFNLLETATWGWDLSETEKRLENALDSNYNCKNSDYNYRKNSFLQSFEDLFRVIQQCTYFIKWREMDDLLIQSSLYLEELLNNNREEKKLIFIF